jgi:hypothetical protein
VKTALLKTAQQTIWGDWRGRGLRRQATATFKAHSKSSEIRARIWIESAKIKLNCRFSWCAIQNKTTNSYVIEIEI